jgi:hypothetical protein
VGETLWFSRRTKRIKCSHSAMVANFFSCSGLVLRGSNPKVHARPSVALDVSTDEPARTASGGGQGICTKDAALVETIINCSCTPIPLFPQRCFLPTPIQRTLLVTGCASISCPRRCNEMFPLRLGFSRNLVPLHERVEKIFLPHRSTRVW